MRQSKAKNIGDPFRPPAPIPLSPTRSLIRAIFSGRRDLLSLLSEDVYRHRVAPLGTSRRGILLVNDPEAVRRIFVAEVADYPKNDLFVGALEPLIGNGIFISNGDVWKRQRRMIEPSFGHMQVGRSFQAMDTAADSFELELDRRASTREVFSLDAAISHLTADVICRATFSTTLESRDAQQIFADFSVFQETVANVRMLRLLLGKPWAEIPQPHAARQASKRIRAHVAALINRRVQEGDRGRSDIAGDIIAARDPDTGKGFSQVDLVDQIGVFFLAGHETSASAVSWALYLLSQMPDLKTRVRQEVETVAGDGPVTLEVTKRLRLTRAVLRETLRLYPPGPFLPRVALQDIEVAGHCLKRGGMVMVSPWIIHRHRYLWRNPDAFDESRFLGAAEKQIPAGAYLPFGLGPRICVGAAFATVESTHIIARLLRRYDVEVVDPEQVRPVARLTTRPAEDIRVRFRRR